MNKAPTTLPLALVLLTLMACSPATTPEPTTGTLRLRSYSAGLATDPSKITAADKVNAILEITAPNGTKTNVVTDDLGFYDLGAVAPGTYTVQPRYFGTTEAKSFTVVAGQATTGEVLIPALANAFYLFNPANAPMQNLNLRKALVEAVSRAAVLTAIGSSGTAATSTLHAKVQGSWSTARHLQSENRTQASANLALAKTELGPTGLSLTILYNITTSNGWEKIATEVGSQWQTHLAGVTVASVGQDWAPFLVTRDTDRNFQVARGGWILDSNNPLSFYRSLATYLTADADYTKRLNQAEADLKARALTAFDADLVALNDYLVDNALVLPLYDY